ncbi:MAG: hypothetical protein J0M09_18145 [Xanthomonadales bacterium]|nr:hypothetical protein [Xanthomonadales bacterium]
MNNFDSSLTTEAAGKPLVEILRAPPEWLLGVSPEAADALRGIGIESIFDLASSRIFESARLLDEAGSDPQSVVYRFGVAPADVVNALPPGVALGDLRYQTLEIIEGVSPAAAVTLADVLSVRNVRDFALWPPHAVARRLVQAAFVPEMLPAADPEAPVDLLPKSGVYPVERVFYSMLVFDGALDRDLPELETATPLNLAPVLSGENIFKTPGEGALLTFSQSWYAQGVALGQLLHSVALAPGESTRIAMIDWSRRTTGRQDESVDETESLSNIADHTRSLAEVTNAVAAEAQSGFSQTNMTSSSEAEGDAFGFSMGPFTVGDSGGSATARSNAMSFSSSAGRRELFGEMKQNVVDRTHQQAHAARNRRASVVREVSQEEHESISTRAVTNYNHMHALSVQYYEIVQIYRVAVNLSKVDKCLFVPLALLDFSDHDIVRRFHPWLLAAAIDDEARRLISTNYRMVELKTLGSGPLSIRNAGMVPYRLKQDYKLVELPPEARLHSFYLMPAGDPAVSLTVKLRDGTTAEVQANGQDLNLPDRPALREIASITGTNPTANPFSSYVALNFTFEGWPFGIDVQMDIPKSTTDLPLLVSMGGGARAELVEHLKANRLHYSQAAFLALDQAEVVLLLSAYNFGGKPVSSIIDPKPLTVAGNYVVFRMRLTPDAESGDTQEKAWARWLREHGLDEIRQSEDLVPLPSGGVFAEAVPGRYNSAEKLDVTRFWNWQDSPIPIVAPEIAAIQAGSRAQPEADLKAGQFSQPLVSIVNPTTLPDPTGLATAFGTIGNGNMFRDMSGLAATIGLAQAGAGAAIDATTAGQIQAGANLATAAKKDVEKFKAALTFAAAMFGRGGTDTSPSTISNEGAKINHGRDMDRRDASTAIGQSAPTGTVSNGGASGGGGSTPAAASPRVSGTSGAQGGESAAFQRAVWGSDGQSRAEMINTINSEPVMSPMFPPPPPPVDPEIFDFQMVTPAPADGTPGGWSQTSCLEIGFQRMGVRIPIRIVVGVPGRTTRQGLITKRQAQTQAANACWFSASALSVALNNGMTIPNLEQWFRAEMQTQLRIMIDVCTVTGCSGGAKVKTLIFVSHGDALQTFVELPPDEV